MSLLTFYKDSKGIIVNPSDDGKLYSIKYSNPNVDWADERILQARGLIIDNDGQIVARPFPKFFNIHELKSRNVNGKLDNIEHLSEPKDLKYELTEKRDGSLAIVFNYENELRFASSGAVNSKHSAKFEKHIYDNYSNEDIERLAEITKQYTVLFEYTGADNFIVVRYKDTEMKIIGVVETKTGKDLSHSEIKELFKDTSFKQVDVIKIDDIYEAQAYFETLENVEGFIIRYEDGSRIKVKTSEYFRLHRINTSIDFFDIDSDKNYNAILDFVLNGQEGDLDDLISSVAEYIEIDKLHKVEAIRNLIASRIELFDKAALVAHEIIDKVHNARDLYKLQPEDIFLSYEDFDVSVAFARTLTKEYDYFVGKSKEYFEIMSITRKQFRNKVSEQLKPIYGNSVNYVNQITPKSFVFNELDKRAYLEYSIMLIQDVNVL